MKKRRIENIKNEPQEEVLGHSWQVKVEKSENISRENKSKTKNVEKKIMGSSVEKMLQKEYGRWISVYMYVCLYTCASYERVNT